MTKRKQPGYYPGYSTLGQKGYWDEATRRVVEDRVHNVPPIRFFNAEELLIMTAVADRHFAAGRPAAGVPHPDRQPHRRAAVREQDRRLPLRRYAVRSRSVSAWVCVRSTRRRARFTIRPFVDLDPLEAGCHAEIAARRQDAGRRTRSGRRCRSIASGICWFSDCVEAYYAHPWAWDEIGYGGPAYPRAYMRLEGGCRSPGKWMRSATNGPRRQIPSPTSMNTGGQMHGSISGQGGTH